MKIVIDIPEDIYNKVINKDLNLAEVDIIGDAITNGKVIEQDRPIGHWISIKDRLPEDGTWNLFTDGKNRSVERYKYDAIDHFFPEGRWFTLEDVVAWMPLPEPYETKAK